MLTKQTLTFYWIATQRQLSPMALPAEAYQQIWDVMRAAYPSSCRVREAADLRDLWTYLADMGEWDALSLQDAMTRLAGCFDVSDISAKAMHPHSMWKSTYQAEPCERRQARLARMSETQRTSITMEEVLRS